MKKKSAFTLAELLVVLAILGIVSAVTMVILQQAAPNQNKVMAKKAYMVTAQIVEDMINDEYLYPEYDNDNVARYEGFDNTTEAKGCSGSTKFSCLFKTYLNGEKNSDGSIVTSDGMKWSISNTTGGSTGKTTVTVDVAADTASTTNNPDTFTMTVANNGVITINEDWAKKAIKLGTKNHLNIK